MKYLAFNYICVFVISLSILCSANSINTNEAYPGGGIVLVPEQDLVLQCNNTNNPSAKIQWLKNGMPLNQTDPRLKIETSNNSITIQKSAESDCGNYTCISGGESAIISVKSTVKLSYVDPSKNVVQNQNIVLVCNVSQGSPFPVFQWFKDDEPINTSDSRVQVKEDIKKNELTISDAKFEDRAKYTCVATNDISSANVTIQVRVKDKYAALWPFLGICAEVAILCTIIFIYEKRRQKPDFDETDAEHNTENKSVPEQDEKNRDIRQRK